MDHHPHEHEHPNLITAYNCRRVVEENGRLRAALLARMEEGHDTNTGPASMMDALRREVEELREEKRMAEETAHHYKADVHRCEEEMAKVRGECETKLAQARML